MDCVFKSEPNLVLNLNVYVSVDQNFHQQIIFASSITPSKQSDCDIESQILSSPDTNQRYYWALLKRKTDDKTYTLFLCLSITIKLLLALRKITECSMLIFLIIAH